MGKVFITCPECRQQLSFTEVAGYQDMLVECPKCHFKAKVSVYQGGAQARGARGSDDSPTEFAGFTKPSTPIGELFVKSTGRTHRLCQGRNVIGRIAQTGTADIRISDDPYMSRSHVRIDVLGKGAGFEHHLVEINSKNIVELNGRPIGRGDILLLKSGDSLMLGRTEVVFRIPDEEETQLV